MMGADEVYDTTFGADLTVMEEADEFLERLKKGGPFPMFTSCCPAWVKYVEEERPHFLKNISTCKSPMEMFAAVLKDQYARKDEEDGRTTYHIAIMPCTAKKMEAKRPEFQHDGKPDVDLVLTTQEIIMMIKESGIRFAELEGESPDLPFGMGTGAATIFGTTGGVAEAVARRVVEDKSKNTLQAIQFSGIRGSETIRAVTLPVGDRALRIAVVHGLVNAQKLLDDIESGQEYFDLVEVMTCKTGCVGGAGQPYGLIPVKQQRAEGLYEADRTALIKRSERNPIVTKLLEGAMKGAVFLSAGGNPCLLGVAGAFQHLRHIRLLPRGIRVGEVSVVAEFTENRFVQTQRIDHAVRRQLAHRANGLLQCSIGVLASAVGIHLHHDRLRPADGVGHTDGAAFSKSRRHNVFCDVAGHVSAAAIHLGAVLAGQRAAAMWCETAVGIHHQLTARESGIRFKAALHKSAGRIDEDLRFGIQREVLKSGLDNMAHDRMAKLCQLHTILMLAGDHYGRDTLGNAELILHRHLRLTVRLQAGNRAQLSRLGQQAGVSFIVSLIGLYILEFSGFNVQYPLLMALFIGFVDALPILRIRNSNDSMGYFMRY